MKHNIHPTAIINPSVEIGENIEIGPFCIIGEDVQIGNGTVIKSNVNIEKTKIGKNCQIFPFTSIGLPPQDTKYNNEDTIVRIGDNNIIREYSTIHRASVGKKRETVIGNNNFLMAYVHIAHNCVLGNFITMANVATLAGHTRVDDYSVIGGLVAVHQFTRIGNYAMVGGFSGVGKDVLPYMLASGSRAELFGINIVGLKRHGFSEEVINELKECYRILFRSNLTIKQAIEEIKKSVVPTKEVQLLLDFINESDRGIMR